MEKTCLYETDSLSNWRHPILSIRKHPPWQSIPDSSELHNKSGNVVLEVDRIVSQTHSAKTSEKTKLIRINMSRTYLCLVVNMPIHGRSARVKLSQVTQLCRDCRECAISNK